MKYYDPTHLSDEEVHSIADAVWDHLQIFSGEEDAGADVSDSLHELREEYEFWSAESKRRTEECLLHALD